MLRYPEPYADPHSRAAARPQKKVHRFDSNGHPFATYNNRGPSDMNNKFAKKQTNNNVVKLIRDKSHAPRMEGDRFYAEDYTGTEAMHSAFAYPPRTSNFVGVV